MSEAKANFRSTVYLNQDEYYTLRRYLREYGMSFSEWVRQKIQEEMGPGTNVSGPDVLRGQHGQPHR